MTAGVRSSASLPATVIRLNAACASCGPWLAGAPARAVWRPRSQSASRYSRSTDLPRAKRRWLSCSPVRLSKPASSSATSAVFLEASPVLAREVKALKRHEIELRITIAVHSNSYRTVRGRTLVAAIFDETAFWRDESTATLDTEVYTAVLPALATTGGMLNGISTPYRKIGLLHQKWRDHFGVNDDDVLVVQGVSSVFNPSLNDAMLAAQRAADPTAASAEWDAAFRSDISAFLDDELIDAAIDHGRPLELPPVEGVVYRAFVDAAGGGPDSYAVAIGHREGDTCVVDVVRGTSGKFDPQSVTREYAALCRDYRESSVRQLRKRLGCRRMAQTAAEGRDLSRKLARVYARFGAVARSCAPRS
jgi:hypothetical protein